MGQIHFDLKVVSFNFIQFLKSILLTSSAEPDKPHRFAASDLVLNRLSMPMLKWVH